MKFRTSFHSRGARSSFVSAAAAATIVTLLTEATPLAQTPPAKSPDAVPAAKTAFEFPCDDYLRGLRGEGNFGTLVPPGSAPFSGSWHLGEDVWLAPGTEIHTIADGVVRYSDFSPSWVDAERHVHWNLGNVVVVEHRLTPPIDGDEFVCSISMHLAADRAVAVGDVVKRGQRLGRIGKDRSEENGLYPAHLHFGLHRGPYLQIPPSFVRELREQARSKEGITVAGEAPIHGEIEVVPNSGTSVVVRAKEGKASVVMSLLIGSTAPRHPPADVAAWVSGYGDRATLDEWRRPSKFISDHAAAGKR